MHTSNLNIFNVSHKGLRYALGELSFLAGQIDYQEENSLRKVESLLNEVILLLESHALSEERVILEALEKKAPRSTRLNLEEHEELEIEILEIKMFFDSAKDAFSEELGDQFYRSICSFQAKYILHMAMEETVMNNLLWSYFTEEELKVLHQSVLDSLNPEMTKLWLKYILPAINPIERKRM